MTTPPWTGFSHGASGIATALLDLFDLTGDERYRATARAAFAYEDLCYSPQHGNWLDVRFPHMVQGETITGSFQTAWCHGAPGIAMARLRAITSDPEGRQRYESTGRIAIATTIGAVERALSGPPTDATLCHGVAGLLEVLLTCALLLDDDVLQRNAAEYASKLMERHAGAGEWPSGITSTGPTPSLMIGTAGVGYHFLRQAAPHDVPGLLLFGR
jgi:lantibiotic modifying enzyme